MLIVVGRLDYGTRFIPGENHGSGWIRRQDWSYEIELEDYCTGLYRSDDWA